MVITSLPFLGFAFSTIMLFLVFPGRYRWISLLISSMAFYWISLSAKPFFFFILFTSFTTWLAGRALDEDRKQLEAKLKEPGLGKADKKMLKTRSKTGRKKILLAALIANIGILAAFKLLNYFTEAFFMLAGFFAGGPVPDTVTLLMPVGISYYTFSTVGYLLDIYWKRYEAEKNFARYLLFASYYPHILQGPISRYSSLGAELKKTELHFTWNNFVIGMESILLGCFKKLVIANRAGLFVENTVQNPNLKGGIYFLAFVLDAIQIYADFSGYMDIVSGISRMFDVELEQNFNHPFLAASVPEFWRRWHMSLGSWFRDYVYYPLTLSRPVKALVRKSRSWKNARMRTLASVIIPIMVTWFLTGLWHGTGKGYIAWGIYYGTLITFSVTFGDDVRKILGKLRVNTECFSYRVFQTIKIFLIFMGGRFLGTPMGMRRRLAIVRSFGDFFDPDVIRFGMSDFDFRVVLFGVIVLIAVAAIEKNENIFVWFNRQNKIFCAIVLYIFIFAVFLLGIYGAAYSAGNFMYQQF